MTRDDRAATVVVVARDATYAARLELALRRLEGWHVEITTPARLPEVARRYPDAILVLTMGEVEMRRLLRGLRDGAGRRVAVALSEQPARQWSSAWRSLGVRAALPSTATPDEVASAVRAVHAGLLVVHPDAVAQPARVAGVATPRLAVTSREREILELIAEGANNRVIASRLAISRHTVKFHVASLMAKLGARSRTEAVALALRAGLLAV